MSRTFDDLLPTPLDAGHLAALAPLTVGADLLALLDRWVERGWLRALDRAFVAFLGERDPQADPLVLLAAALASHQLGHGHVCLDLAETLAEPDFALSLPPEGDALAGPLLLPSQLLERLDLATWCQRLQGSALVALGSSEAQASRPLVLSGQRLYLRRYWAYERRIDSALRERLEQAEPTPADLRARLDALFEGSALAGQVDWQKLACALATRSAFSIITGGPGTGKTTTIARLLLLLAAQARHTGQPLPEVALAAPTGRAAERMAESLRVAVQRLQEQGLDPALCAALPSTGTTLHRLLGVIPDSPRFRHHADNPLPVDVVVVDEASMIDLPMMAKLVDAIASGTRLILLGDPDQLPSVEAGDVLSAILRASGDGIGTRADDAQALHGLLAPVTLQPQATPRAFAGRRVQLQRGYRQSNALDLAPLAHAVREGDSSAALQLLRSGELAGVHFHEGEADPLRGQREHLLGHWRALADAADPVLALQQAGRLRVLTALREGPQGARGLNSRIEQLLAGNAPGYFQGRLLLVTENSYRHRLFNGDIGICLRDGSGAMVAWFPGDTVDQPRAFHPAALPAHESAFAMTVHKAQGSEFDEVWLQLPRQDSRVLSRELVYTGLTRARQVLHVAGSADVLQAALKRHASRLGGLAWRLGAEDVAEEPARIEQPTVQGTLF